MAKDLTWLWGNLSLSEEENAKLEINAGAMEGVVTRGNLCLIIPNNIIRVTTTTSYSLITILLGIIQILL
jgi:hypothetical protein